MTDSAYAPPGAFGDVNQTLAPNTSIECGACGLLASSELRLVDDAAEQITLAQEVQWALPCFAAAEAAPTGEGAARA